MTTSTQKVGITERALIARIRRALYRQNEEILRRDRGHPMYANHLGWHIISSENHLVAANVDLEELAKELCVLRPWEQVIYEKPA